MNSPFLYGFTDELRKEAAHPLLEPLVRGTTMLGKKVQGMMGKVIDRAQGIRNMTKGGKGLKAVTKVSSPMTAADLFKAAEYGDDAGDDKNEGDDSDVLKTILDEAQARLNDQSNEQGYSDQQGGVGNEDYGTGGGLAKSKKKAPFATAHDLKR